MAKVEKLTVQVNIEAVMQKELIKVINKVHVDHGLMINAIDFDWITTIDGKAQITSCNTTSTYVPKD